MKTVIIFGGSGFIGRHIIRRLSKKGFRIIVPYQRPIIEPELRLYGDVGQIIPIKFNRLSEDKIIKSIDNSKLKSFDYRNYTANIKKFNSETGWKPKTGINNGIIKTIDYLNINKI